MTTTTLSWPLLVTATLLPFLHYIKHLFTVCMHWISWKPVVIFVATVRAGLVDYIWCLTHSLTTDLSLNEALTLHRGDLVKGKMKLSICQIITKLFTFPSNFVYLLHLKNLCDLSTGFNLLSLKFHDGMGSSAYYF